MCLSGEHCSHAHLLFTAIDLFDAPAHSPRTETSEQGRTLAATHLGWGSLGCKEYGAHQGATEIVCTSLTRRRMAGIDVVLTAAVIL